MLDSRKNLWYIKVLFEDMISMKNFPDNISCIIMLAAAIIIGCGTAGCCC